MSASAAGSLRFGIVKQVSSGDTIHVRDTPKDRRPNVKIIVLSGIAAPKIERFNKKDNSVVEPEEAYAWDAREFLRSKLIGQEVYFTSKPFSNAASVSSSRELGKVYFPKGNDIAEEIVANGFAKVKGDKSKSQDPEVAKLVEAEENAKKKGVGIWNNKNKEKHVRKIKYIGKEGLANLVAEHGKKPIQAIVEDVKSSSKNVLVDVLLLPSNNYVTMALAGIQFEHPNETDRDFKDEAKFFVEVRLLQRDGVQVFIEKADTNWAIGCLIHPKGDIAEALLAEGFVRLDPRTMSPKNSSKLQIAENLAKSKRMRMWKNEPPAAPKTSKIEMGTVYEIVNGDSIKVKLNNGEIKKYFLASIRSPKKETRNNDSEEIIQREDKKGPPRIFDTPLIYEAREYLRSKLIGKRVNVIHEYVLPQRNELPEKTCCSILLNKENVAVELVRKGLAVVVDARQHNGNFASNYAELLEAQEDAKKKHLGCHDKVEPPKIKVNDCTGKKAHDMFNLLNKKPRMDAVVEYVMSGSRMRLRIPKDSIMITFLLSGIYCPRMNTGGATAGKGREAEPEKYAEAALNFTKDKILQREVEITIESKDKFGSMIGTLYVGNTNLALALVEEGLASVAASADRILQQAEKVAKEKRLNLWLEDHEEKKDVEENDVGDRALNYKDVFISVVAPDLHVYAQLKEEQKAFDELQETLRKELSSTPPISSNKPPAKGKLYAAKYSDDQWYRGKVEKVYSNAGKALVHYIDYGNKLEIPFEDLAPLPDACAYAKPFAHEYGIACVQPPPEQYLEDVVQEFLREIGNRPIRINEEYREHNLTYISIIESETKEDLVKQCIASGLFFAQKNRKEKKFKSLIDEYNEAQEEAKKKRLLIWEYGDVREDEAKEFGLGK